MAKETSSKGTTPTASTSWHIDPKTIVPGRELGRGSFGVVRAATWRHTPVAMKILYTDAQADDKELFEREVAMMATLHHPNIVQFLGYTRTPSLTLVIEFFPEGSLEDYVKKHKSNPKTNLRFCFEMACAIEYLHSRSPSIVIHRDIKPANFLLTASHRVKLGDFGIARTRRHRSPRASSRATIDSDIVFQAPVQHSFDETGSDDDAAPPSSSSTSCAIPRPSPLGARETQLPSTEDLTSNCGTVRFMAPEVASPDGRKRTTRYTAKADVFSLALVFYFVWERVLPAIPNHNTPATHLSALHQGKRPPFSSKTPKMARELVASMWQFDASDRPSATELLDDLVRLRGSSGSSLAAAAVLGPLRADSGAKTAGAGKDHHHHHHKSSNAPFGFLLS